MRTTTSLMMIAVVALTAAVLGQGPQAPATPPPTSPPTAKAAAPIDLTGNWVSIITEDWRWRMVTPAKGERLRAGAERIRPMSGDIDQQPGLLDRAQPLGGRNGGQYQAPHEFRLRGGELDGNLGSKITMKYPSVYLMESGAHGEASGNSGDAGSVRGERAHS